MTVTWIRWVSVCSALLLGIEGSRAAERIDRGLIVFYDFSQTDGNVIHDRSGVGDAIDLEIATPKSVVRRSGSIIVNRGARISSRRPAKKLNEAVHSSGSISIEAWIRTSAADQTGPARIITLSESPSRRNFTLGQEKDAYDVRFRTTTTDQNGNPSLRGPSGSAALEIRHVVYTRSQSGQATLFIDGKAMATRSVPGRLASWDQRFRLTLANEITGDRPWTGELYLVAIYDRSLSAREVQQNFAAGPQARGLTTDERLTLRREREQRAHFDQRVAPLLAKHCLECHDPARPSGKLDLSRWATTAKGGESGKAVVPGKLDESLLWDYVASDEMPKDRDALSQQEKQILKTWIEQGAVWTVQQIDPAIYAHSAGAGEIWVQRLTIPEYVETVRATVGVDIEKEANDLLPPDLRADGFRNTAYNLGVDLKHIEAYDRLAETIVKRMDVAQFASRFSKQRKFNDDKMRQFVAAMGRVLLRGPLSDDEVTVYSGVATTAASAGGSYLEAVSYVIRSMLQSPRFLYRIENHRGDGRPRPVSSYELASRMSYILWGGPPDEQLLRAAESGELLDRATCAKQIDRMLKDDRARRHSRRFIADWLNLPRLQNLNPDRQRFPNWTQELAQDMQSETLQFWDEVVWVQRRPLADLLNAQVTFATPRLSKHYGLEAIQPTGQKYDLNDVPERGGLLTHASVLTIGGDEASMVARGLFVFHDLLRGTVNAPPPCVNTTPPDTRTGLTQRGIAESRIADQQCGICHIRFEPLAFGLERFDGIGVHHTQDEHGNRLRQDGEILFPGTARPRQYRSADELMNLLASSDRVRESLTWKLTQWSMGRPLTALDAKSVRQIHQQAQSMDGTYQATMKTIILSDLVQSIRTESNASKRPQ